MFRNGAFSNTALGWSLILFLATAASRGMGQSSAPRPLSDDPRLIRFEAFVRGDLESADQVVRYTEELSQRIPGLLIEVHDVLKDREQLKRLYELSEKFGRPKAVVPSFYCCNKMYFGFDDAASSGPRIENLLTAHVYTRSTCPRCQDAKAFIPLLNSRWPAIQFRIYEITSDVNARATWERLCRGVGQVPGLPTLDFAGHVIIGFQGSQITGKKYEELIEKVSGTTPDAGPKQAKIEDGAGIRRFLNANSLVFSVPASVHWTTLLLSSQDPVEDAELDQLELPGEATASEMGEATLRPAPTASGALDETIELPVFGKIRVSDMGLPAFTFAVGLVDGFNPCAMWILVFLLSVLVNIRDRRKILAIAGTFVVVSGLAYFAFMAAWLQVFMLIGIRRPVQILLGLLALVIGVVNVKDFVAFKQGISFSIPESSKPGLYRRVRKIVSSKYLTAAIAGAVVLAVVVNFIELLCTAGLPALYTQILTIQDLPAWQNYAYLSLYIAAYMLDDTLLLAVIVATLSHRKLQEREGRWLKLVSGVVILILGLVMIFQPKWLELGRETANLPPASSSSTED